MELKKKSLPKDDEYISIVRIIFYQELLKKKKKIKEIKIYNISRSWK